MTTSPDLEHSFFIGLISGTSMDGIDAALVQFSDRGIDVRATLDSPYPDELREQLFAASRAPEHCGIDTLGMLNTWVGECFRDASIELIAAAGVDASQVRAIGSHGQTVRHRPDLTHRFTMQIGDPSIIAAGTGIDTVADFRLVDMALGGEGAPLAPAFHDWLLGHSDRDRVVLNIGGIANITVLPAGGGSVLGYDTGPGNTLLDAWVAQHSGASFDENGDWAAGGNVNEQLLGRLLADAWFSQAPPKSTGFEYFNLEWLESAQLAGIDPRDLQATLAELTARSIADAILQSAPATAEVFVCGGGAHNAYLMGRLDALLPQASVATTAAVGLDPDWVEAVAFSWLAMRRVTGEPGNLPAVTGASRPALLGAIYTS